MKISCILWVFNNVGLAASQTYLMPTFSDSKPTAKLEINSPKLKLIDLFTNKYILFTYNSGGRKVSDWRIGLKKKSFGLTNNNPFKVIHGSVYLFPCRYKLLAPRPLSGKTFDLSGKTFDLSGKKFDDII